MADPLMQARQFGNQVASSIPDPKKVKAGQPNFNNSPTPNMNGHTEVGGHGPIPRAPKLQSVLKPVFTGLGNLISKPTTPA